MLLMLAALPGLFWEGGADTAQALRDAGIDRVYVSAEKADAWKGVPGIAVETASLQGRGKLITPRVNYRPDQGSASRAPWLEANGWRFVRQPQGKFYYDLTGPAAGLAAAEAYAWGADALIKCDAAGLKPLGEMLTFLRGLQAADLPPVADFGYIDDGTATSGEVMNLMTRSNLLFRPVRAPDRSLKLNVRLGDKDFPVEQARNPGAMAQIIRAKLSDERRSLRLYGSAVVVGRLTAAGGRARLHLINYDGAARKVSGLHVRLLGQYSKHQVAAAGSPGEELLDFSVLPDATEFSLPELKTYAVVDLSK
jgi:hypothetical protein